jgi:acyl-CoA synthetase (AMP-forming)/AMP-acid ligase II
MNARSKAAWFWKAGDMNVVESLHRRARISPDAIALVDADSGAQLTFSQLADGIARAGGSLARAVDAPGGAVALLADAGLDYLLVDYGAMHAGLVRVPLDPSLMVEELAEQIADSGATALVYGARQRETAEAVAQSSHGLKLFPLASLADPAAERLPCRDAAPGDLASLSYTGGSTGRPKAVAHSHGSLLAVLQNIAMARDAGEGDVFLNVRPLWPIAAVVVFSHLVAGGTVVSGGAFTPERFIDQLSRFHATHTSLVPTHLHRLLGQGDPVGLDLPALRAIEIGAAAVPPDLYALALRVFGPRLAVLYGLTEAPWSCYRPTADAAMIRRDDPDTHGNVGRPLFASEISVANNGAPCPPGVVGEVRIRGPHVMIGYWRQPERTAAAMVDGWFHTGDVGFIDLSGHLFIRGRIKDVIRSGGKTVQPAEVEEVLRNHPAIADAAVIGLPDDEWGEIVAAAVILHDGATVDEAEILAYSRARLAGHKRPRKLRILSEIPRSHYGKVQQARLAAAFGDTP